MSTIIERKQTTAQQTSKGTNPVKRLKPLVVKTDPAPPLPELSPIADWRTHAARRQRDEVLQPMAELADATAADGEIRVVSLLTAFCSHCGAKLHASYPKDHDYCSWSNDFDNMEEQRGILLIEPCPNCSNVPLDYMSSHFPTRSDKASDKEGRA